MKRASSKSIPRSRIVRSRLAGSQPKSRTLANNSANSSAIAKLPPMEVAIRSVSLRVRYDGIEALHPVTASAAPQLECIYRCIVALSTATDIVEACGKLGQTPPALPLPPAALSSRNARARVANHHALYAA